MICGKQLSDGCFYLFVMEPIEMDLDSFGGRPRMEWMWFFVEEFGAIIMEVTTKKEYDNCGSDKWGECEVPWNT